MSMARAIAVIAREAQNFTHSARRSSNARFKGTLISGIVLSSFTTSSFLRPLNFTGRLHAIPLLRVCPNEAAASSFRNLAAVGNSGESEILLRQACALATCSHAAAMTSSAGQPCWSINSAPATIGSSGTLFASRPAFPFPVFFAERRVSRTRLAFPFRACRIGMRASLVCGT